MFIIDEIHLLSDAQMDACYEVMSNATAVLGLTGTLSSWTESELDQRLRLPVICNYSIDQAIQEGVIVDYQITVLKVPLDNYVVQEVKGKARTEKKHFDAY